MMTEPGLTMAGGRKTHLSTCAAVRAATHRMSSGTSVPNPRTSRSMGALHFVRPDRGTVHAWRGWPQFGKPIGDSSDEQQCHGAVNDPSDFLGASVRWSLDVHILLLTYRTQLSGPRFPSLSLPVFNGLARLLSPQSHQIARKWDYTSHLRTSDPHPSSIVYIDCAARLGFSIV